MKIAIIGTGAYGLALANQAALKNENDIIVWSESEEKLKIIKETRKFDLLPGIEINKKIKFTNSLKEAVEKSEIIFIAVAAKWVDSVSKDMRPFLNRTKHICICSKGIEQDTCKFVHEVFLSFYRTKKLAVISGPSFAIDIAKKEPVGLTVACKCKKTIKLIKSVLCNDNFKLRETDDYVGVEVCGSIKNVIAIASGIISGLGYSDSTRAFLITEALHDMKELINGLGGNKNTILSYAGVGDLLLTCTSTKSRNFSYGLLLGKGEIEVANKYQEETTVEGYYTLKSIYTLIKRKKIKIPVIDLIYKIVMKKGHPSLLVKFLVEKK